MAVCWRRASWMDEDTVKGLKKMEGANKAGKILSLGPDKGVKTLPQVEEEMKQIYGDGICLRRSEQLKFRSAKKRLEPQMNKAKWSDSDIVEALVPSASKQAKKALKQQLKKQKNLEAQKEKEKKKNGQMQSIQDQAKEHFIPTALALALEPCVNGQSPAMRMDALVGDRLCQVYSLLMVFVIRRLQRLSKKNSQNGSTHESLESTIRQLCEDIKLVRENDPTPLKVFWNAHTSQDDTSSTTSGDVSDNEVNASREGSPGIPSDVVGDPFHSDKEALEFAFHLYFLSMFPMKMSDSHRCNFFLDKDRYAKEFGVGANWVNTRAIRAVRKHVNATVATWVVAYLEHRGIGFESPKNGTFSELTCYDSFRFVVNFALRSSIPFLLSVSRVCPSRDHWHHLQLILNPRLNNEQASLHDFKSLRFEEASATILASNTPMLIVDGDSFPGLEEEVEGFTFAHEALRPVEGCPSAQQYRTQLRETCASELLVSNAAVYDNLHGLENADSPGFEDALSFALQHGCSVTDMRTFVIRHIFTNRLADQLPRRRFDREDMEGRTL